MAENEQEKKGLPSGEVKETSDPTPLAQEGGTVQLEIETKPPKPDKNTIVSHGDKNFIKNILNTPKEGPGGDNSSTTSSPSGASDKKTPSSEEVKSLKDQIAKEREESGSSGGGEPASKDDCIEAADHMVEIFCTILAWLLKLYALDTDDTDYQMDGDSKRKIKKHLAKMLEKSKKNYNPGIWFFAAVVTTILPLFLKAHGHRSKVKEERARNKPKVINITDTVEKKRKRKKLDDFNNDGNKGDDGAEFYPTEEVK